MFSSAELFRYSIRCLLVCTVTKHVPEFVADCPRDQLVYRDAQIVGQLLSAGSMLQEQCLLEDNGVLIDTAECNAATIEVQPAQQGLPFLGTHYDPVPTLQSVNRILDEHGLQPGKVLFAFLAIVAAAARPVLSVRARLRKRFYPSETVGTG
jgi:hypothetical protein